MWFWRDWDMWIIDRDDWIWSSRIEDSLIKEVEKITNTKVIKIISNTIYLFIYNVEMFKETINEERLINYLTWYLPN